MKKTFDSQDFQSGDKSGGFYISKDDVKLHSSARGKKKSKRQTDRNRVREDVTEFINEGNPNTEKKNEQAKAPEQKQKEDFNPSEEQGPSAPVTSTGSQLPRDEGDNFYVGDQENKEGQESGTTYRTDEDLVQKIKQSIQKEQSLASSSQNIQVTVRYGVATLRGEVHSEQERMTIGDKAASYVGFGKVVNELVVIERKM